ncbi:hypothetical protein [Novosphingobium aquimarinum]|uniref:hypothetical protein n=1 Tax=Novosphingobium aquimarinum TaxID=2682494 RepID=UPI0012EBF39F|nr:hypothetical protein [Novosphingobium aquimarinum]
MAITILYLAVCVACWTYAIRYGDRAARFAFVSFVAMTIGTIFATSESDEFRTHLSFWTGFNTLLFVTDLLYFAALFWIAGTSRRYWPIWSAGFALLCVLTHFGPLIDPASDSKIYRGLESFWQLPILATMVIGIARDKAGGVGRESNPARNSEGTRRSLASRIVRPHWQSRVRNGTSVSVNDRR